jgi:TatD DNase family protein
LHRGETQEDLARHSTDCARQFFALPVLKDTSEDENLQLC